MTSLGQTTALSPLGRAGVGWGRGVVLETQGRRRGLQEAQESCSKCAALHPSILCIFGWRQRFPGQPGPSPCRRQGSTAGGVGQRQFLGMPLLSNVLTGWVGRSPESQSPGHWWPLSLTTFPGRHTFDHFGAPLKTRNGQSGQGPAALSSGLQWKMASKVVGGQQPSWPGGWPRNGGRKGPF